MKIDNIDIDEDKLKLEDRRLLLSYLSEQRIWNGNNLLMTSSLLFSSFALIIAALSFIYVYYGGISNRTFLVIAIVLFIICIFSYKLFRHTINIFTKGMQSSGDLHKTLFEKHLRYAKKEKS
jgi:hypothetical protein